MMMIMLLARIVKVVIMMKIYARKGRHLGRLWASSMGGSQAFWLIIVQFLFVANSDSEYYHATDCYLSGDWMSGSGLDSCSTLTSEGNAGAWNRHLKRHQVTVSPHQSLFSSVSSHQSYGKLTYFITLFPYVVLTTFLVMGSFEEGFASGITEYYLKVKSCPTKVVAKSKVPESAQGVTRR